MSKPPDNLKDLLAYTKRMIGLAEELNRFFVDHDCTFHESMNLFVIVIGSQIDGRSKDKTADERKELVTWAIARITEQLQTGFVVSDAIHGKTTARN